MVFEIIDGFHRWTLGLRDDEVRAASDNKVPVVFVTPVDAAAQMLSTVRHNRARGQHGILKMGDIVRALRDRGLDDDEICRRMGMEEEELERLADLRGSPTTAGQDSFGRGWVPVLPPGEAKVGKHKVDQKTKKKKLSEKRKLNGAGA